MKIPLFSWCLQAQGSIPWACVLSSCRPAPWRETKHGVGSALLRGGDGGAPWGLQQSGWVWEAVGVNSGSLLVSQLPVVKWASSSADLLCHKPQSVLPVLQSSQRNYSTPCSILEAEQQIWWYSLETWTEILKKAAYSRGMIGKGIDFYLNANWVPLLGRNGLEGTNVQMATKFVILFLWLLSLGYFSNIISFARFKGPLCFHSLKVMQICHCLSKFEEECLAFLTACLLLPSDPSASLGCALTSCPSCFR